MQVKLRRQDGELALAVLVRQPSFVVFEGIAHRARQQRSGKFVLGDEICCAGRQGVVIEWVGARTVLMFGALFALTGNLLAPVVAHAAINAINLRWLGQRYG